MNMPVKWLVSAGLLVLSVSCKKHTETDGTAARAILGRWNVVSDEGFTGIAQNNQPVNYTGQPGDYFDFNENGKLYMKESTRADTTDYRLTSDTTVQIGGVGLVLNGLQAISVIENLTPHTVTLHAAVVLTPGGAFGRKIKLAR